MNPRMVLTAPRAPTPARPRHVRWPPVLFHENVTGTSICSLMFAGRAPWPQLDRRSQHLLVPAGCKVWLYLAAPTGGLLTTPADPGACTDAAVALAPHFVTKGMFHDVDDVYRHLPAGAHQYVLGKLAGTKDAAPLPPPTAEIVELDEHDADFRSKPHRQLHGSAVHECPVCGRTDRASSCPACMPTPDITATTTGSASGGRVEHPSDMNLVNKAKGGRGAFNHGFLLGRNTTSSIKTTAAASKHRPGVKRPPSLGDGEPAATAPGNELTLPAVPPETKGPAPQDDVAIDSDGVLDKYPLPPELPRTLPAADKPCGSVWTVEGLAAIAVVALALALALCWAPPSGEV